MLALISSLSLLPLLASAAPAGHTLGRRDVCNGIGDTPELYHQYLSKACPPKYTMTSKGVCKDMWPWNSCTAFCQVRTSFTYGREQPFNVACTGPLTCTITTQDTTSYTLNLNGNLGYKFSEALNAGISGGFSVGTTHAFSQAHQIKLNDNECGYFTWVPVVKNVCGTMSSKEVIWNLNENGLVTKECAGPPTSIGNYCVSKQRDPGGKPDGRTVWVKTDCVTNLPLPKNQQNPIYQQKGVAMHRGGQMARALSDGAKQQHGGSSNGLYIHLQGKKDCSTGSKVLVTCFGWPKDTCCKSGLARKNAAFFGGKTALDHQYTNYISDNPTGVPSQYCTTIKGTGRTQTAGQGVCVSGAKGTGGASWSPILGCPTLSACSGPPGRRSLEPDTNGTMSANGQTEPTCKESVFGDHLAFPKEGGVLVIPGWRAEDLEDTLAALPDDDETLVEKYRELGAKHYPRVSDYSETLNEDGTSKSDVGE